MSLAPSPVPRKQLHLRSITCEGFVRDDGLIDIEGLLIDTKPEPLRLVNREVPAGDPIHKMRIRMTVNQELYIVDAQIFSENAPYSNCEEVEEKYKNLIGMRIEPGFSREVKRIFSGTKGCTHITELIGPLASTAFQVLWANTDFRNADLSIKEKRLTPLGGCHALRLDGHIVQTYFPEYHKNSNP